VWPDYAELKRLRPDTSVLRGNSLGRTYGPGTAHRRSRTRWSWPLERLRFLTDLRIPPTSNQAERDLRPAKTQQKVSGRLRSEAATRNRYAIRGYASTAVKNNVGALTAIRDALAAKPVDADHPRNSVTSQQ